jgi:hypothetical protein
VDPAALAIIWNVQSDWQRDDAVETREARVKELRELNNA